jgi:hypothetical protein
MSLGPNSVNAAQLYQWPRVRQDFPFKAQVLDELVFYDIQGGSLRTATVRKFDPDDFADIVPFCDEITDRTRQPEGRVHEFGEIGSSYTVCYTAQDPRSYPNDQDAEQGKLATDTVTYKFLQMLADGVAGVGSFEGLAAQVDPSKIYGAPGLFAPLDVWQAFRLGIDTNSGWSPIIMGNEDALLAFLKANNDLGFNPDEVNHRVPTGHGGWDVTRVPSLIGAKFLLNNCIKTRINNDGSTVTNVYCMQLGPSGVFCMKPAGRPDMITRRETIIPGRSQLYVDYTLTVGVVVAAKGALTMLKDILVAEAPPA